MAQLKLFGSARGGARVAKRGKKDKPARQKKPLKALAIVLTVLLCLEGLYFLCIYSNIPFIVKYRTIYINTAMNTMRHQWLATYFIPDNVIDKVRYEYGLQVAASNGRESQWGQCRRERRGHETDSSTRSRPRSSRKGSPILRTAGPPRARSVF